MIDALAWLVFAAIAVAGVSAIWMKAGGRRCPECRGWISREASRCRHCAVELD